MNRFSDPLRASGMKSRIWSLFGFSKLGNEQHMAESFDSISDDSSLKEEKIPVRSWAQFWSRGKRSKAYGAPPGDAPEIAKEKPNTDSPIDLEQLEVDATEKLPPSVMIGDLMEITIQPPKTKKQRFWDFFKKKSKSAKLQPPSVRIRNPMKITIQPSNIEIRRFLDIFKNKSKSARFQPPSVRIRNPMKFMIQPSKIKKQRFLDFSKKKSKSAKFHPPSVRVGNLLNITIQPSKTKKRRCWDFLKKKSKSAKFNPPSVRIGNPMNITTQPSKIEEQRSLDFLKKKSESEKLHPPVSKYRTVGTQVTEEEDVIDIQVASKSTSTDPVIKVSVATQVETRALVSNSCMICGTCKDIISRLLLKESPTIKDDLCTPEPLPPIRTHIIDVKEAEAWNKVANH